MEDLIISYVSNEAMYWQPQKTIHERGIRAVSAYDAMKQSATFDFDGARDIIASWHDTFDDRGLALSSACKSMRYEDHAAFMSERLATATLIGLDKTKRRIADLDKNHVNLLKAMVWMERGIFPRLIQN